MFWTLVLMGVSVSGISYVGQFADEATCLKAQEVARAQSVRAVCVQMQRAESASPTAPAKK
jgi:hypothetical protein